MGIRFRDEIADVLKSASASPLLWRERQEGFRRINCPVFTRYVAYVIRGDALVVVAIVHGHRAPGTGILAQAARWMSERERRSTRETY